MHALTNMKISKIDIGNTLHLIKTGSLKKIEYYKVKAKKGKRKLCTNTVFSSGVLVYVNTCCTNMQIHCIS